MVIHSGQCLNEDNYKFSANKCVEDFTRQCNMFLLTLNMPIHMLEVSFFLNVVPLVMVVTYFLFLTILRMMFTWTIAMHKVLMVPWTPDCNLLPHLAGVMDPELWFPNGYIKFIKMALNSDNIITVRIIINVSFNGT